VAKMAAEETFSQAGGSNRAPVCMALKVSEYW